MAEMNYFVIKETLNPYNKQTSARVDGTVTPMIMGSTWVCLFSHLRTHRKWLPPPPMSDQMVMVESADEQLRTHWYMHNLHVDITSRLFLQPSEPGCWCFNFHSLHWWFPRHKWNRTSMITKGTNPLITNQSKQTEMNKRAIKQIPCCQGLKLLFDIVCKGARSWQCWIFSL